MTHHIFPNHGVPSRNYRLDCGLFRPHYIIFQSLALSSQRFSVYCQYRETTVKNQVTRLLSKFDLRRRSELRHLLFNWDFNAWQIGGDWYILTN